MDYVIRPETVHIGDYYLEGTHTGGISVMRVVKIDGDSFLCVDSFGNMIRRVSFFAEPRGILAPKEKLEGIVQDLITNPDFLEEFARLQQIQMPKSL